MNVRYLDQKSAAVMVNMYGFWPPTRTRLQESLVEQAVLTNACNTRGTCLALRDRDKFTDSNSLCA